MNPKTLLCVVLSMASMGQLALAADVTSTWDGSNDIWSDDSHWDSLLFPNNGYGGLSYDAVINGGTVTLDQAISIEALQPTNGTITGTSDLTILGLLTWTGSTMSGMGTTNANGGLDLSGAPSRILSGRTINNAGVATWDEGGFNTGQGTPFLKYS